ncbi:MAG TPA: type II toxin-antitoxin system VapC family toxin [Kofleriaceae bacterium]
MSLLYLDSCCIIYLVEAASPFHAAVVRRISVHGAATGAALVTSRLTRLECRTKPLRDADAGLLARYETFFTAQRFRIAEISPAIVEAATNLRAKYGFKTPDAIHLATAILENSDTFLTGDAQLERCTEARVEVIT